MKLLKSNAGLFFVILLSLLPLIALLNPGLPLTHDGQDHVARIANFYQSLSEGNIVPRWAGNLNWGYGHPILMFLYPASSYFASFFHFLGFSLVDSTKLVFAVAFIASGVTMYLWLREYLGETAAVVGSTIYNFAPYRFVDLYVRGAIGEHMAFIFPPLVIYCLLKISQVRDVRNFWVVGGSWAVAGLLLSHNALAIMFIPFILFYAIYLILNVKNRRLLTFNFLLIAILGIGLSAFFLLPAFAEGKYTLRDIVTQGVALSRFVNLDQLIYSAWDFGQTGQFSVQVGIALWLSLLLSPLAAYKFYKSKNRTYIIVITTILYFLISIFLMLPISKPIWETFSILQKFQFPWRFLSISVFAGSFLAALFIASIRNKNAQTLIAIVFIILAVLTTVNYWQPKDYLQKNESFYSGIYDGTTDTGESAPIWSVRFMEKQAKDTFNVVEGEAMVKKISRTSTQHSYEVNAMQDIKFVENTLYFPGWKVYLDGEENKNIQFQDAAHRGLITFNIPQGKHYVDIKFEDTKLRQLANLISVVSVILLGGLGVLGLLVKKR